MILYHMIPLRLLIYCHLFCSGIICLFYFIVYNNVIWYVLFLYWLMCLHFCSFIIFSYVVSPFSYLCKHIMNYSFCIRSYAIHCTIHQKQTIHSCKHSFEIQTLVSFDMCHSTDEQTTKASAGLETLSMKFRNCIYENWSYGSDASGFPRKPGCSRRPSTAGAVGLSTSSATSCGVILPP